MKGRKERGDFYKILPFLHKGEGKEGKIFIKFFHCCKEDVEGKGMKGRKEREDFYKKIPFLHKGEGKEGMIFIKFFLSYIREGKEGMIFIHCKGKGMWPHLVHLHIIENK
jgi:hypothetical protein